MTLQLTNKRIERFATISRIDEEQRMVYGIATDETPVYEWADTDIEVVVSHAATKKAVARWLEWGNIREMHQARAVGVAREVTFNDVKRETYVAAYIADDQAWEKVKAQVYKGFSILGPIHAWDQPDKKMKRITVTDYDLDEISLCDRPKNPTSRITLWRAAGQGDEAPKEILDEEVNPVTKQLQRAAALWIAGGDPYLHVMDIETPWDEAGAIAAWLERSTENERINWAEYGRAFLLRDAANEEAVESYRLPFSAVSSFKYCDDCDEREELAAIPAALFAAVTAMQAMTDLTDTTQRALEARIAAYYHAMDRHAPWEIQQAKEGGQNVDSLQAMWKAIMGEEAVPADAAKATELMRAKLTPVSPPAPIIAPTEPALEIKRALDGIASIDAKMTAFDERLKKIEAMPVMPMVQRTDLPEQSIDEKIAKLERAIKAQKLAPDAPEVVEVQRLYQQKRSAKQ